MSNFANHDEYINASPEPFNEMLRELRGVLAQALPEAEQVIAYNMPGFRVGKSIIAGYASFSKQCGLYVSHQAILENSEDISRAGLKATKMGVTFPPKKPIPMALAAQLALASLADHAQT